MKFLLTGGSGFIGSNLARTAIAKGHAVRALVRRTSVRTVSSSWVICVLPCSRLTSAIATRARAVRFCSG